MKPAPPGVDGRLPLPKLRQLAEVTPCNSMLMLPWVPGPQDTARAGDRPSIEMDAASKPPNSQRIGRAP